MKMKIFSISVILSSLLIFSSCEKKENTIALSNAVRFVSSYTSGEGQNYLWQETDHIGIFMYKAETELGDVTIVNGTINRDYKASAAGSNASFNPLNEEQTIYYPNSDVASVNFIAYSPHIATITDFTLPLSTKNQETPRNIDLLYSNNVKDQNRNNTSVSFLFTHRLSKLAFTINPGFGLTEADLQGLTVTISGTNTEASFSLVNGGITEANSPADITALTAANGKTTEAIIIPGDYSSTGVKFKVTLASGITLEATPSNPDFVSGKKYTYSLTLEKDAPIREIECRVQDWETEDRGSLDMNETGGGSTNNPDTNPEEKPVPTANCYIVAPSGTVTIPVSIANKALSGQIAENAELTGELVWTDGSGLKSDAPVAKIEIEGKGPSALLKITAGSSAGNAVVAVKADGKIKWSWHIWVTSYNPETENVTIGSYTFMTRNLGATKATHTPSAKSELVMGLHYQWGRKDPFVCASSFSANPTERPLKNGESKIVTISTALTSSTNGTIVHTIENPLTFLRTAKAKDNWYTSSSPSPNSLWGNSKTHFDPCPHGWKVPPTAAFSSFSENGTYIQGVSEWMDPNGNPPHGMKITSESKELYFPTAGARTDTQGSLSNNTDGGYYWSHESSSSSTTSLYMTFALDKIKHNSETNGRAYGFSVRCIKE